MYLSVYFTSVFHKLFITLSLGWKTSCYPDSGKQPVNICAANHEILTNLTFISHGWWFLLLPIPRHHLNDLVIEHHTSVSPSKVAHWNLITLFQGAVSVTRVRVSQISQEMVTIACLCGQNQSSAEWFVVDLLFPAIAFSSDSFRVGMCDLDRC